jgi:hypothetical protein
LSGPERALSDEEGQGTLADAGEMKVMNEALYFMAGFRF